MASSPAIVLGLALTAGCMNIPTTAWSERLPKGHLAPGPTVVLPTLQCPAPPPGATAGHETVLVQEPRLPAIAGVMNTHIRPTTTEALSPASCSIADQLSGDVGQQWSLTRAPQDLLDAMHAAGARSALVSFARNGYFCRAVGVTDRCWEQTVFVASMVFDDAGNALWRGSKLVILQESEPHGRGRDIDDNPLAIYKNVPIRRE